MNLTIPLAVGDIVVPTERHLSDVRKMYPSVELSSQLRIVALVDNAYHRKCVMVIDRPGGGANRALAVDG